MSDDATDGAQDALNRMQRAHDRGTGCYLTADMVASLGVTMIGQMWAYDDPRAPAPQAQSVEAERGVG